MLHEEGRRVDGRSIGRASRDLARTIYGMVVFRYGKSARVWKYAQLDGLENFVHVVGSQLTNIPYEQTPSTRSTRGAYNNTLELKVVT